MEYDDAFWRLVDVVNLKRHVADAETLVASAEAKIADARRHTEEAKDARAEAKRQLDEVKQKLQVAEHRAAEIPSELAEAAGAEVYARNDVRDRVIKAMAGVATAIGTAGAN